MKVLPGQEIKQELHEPKKGTKLQLLLKWVESHCFERTRTKSKENSLPSINVGLKTVLKCKITEF